MTFTIDWFLEYYPCHNQYNNIDVSAFTVVFCDASVEWFNNI